MESMFVCESVGSAVQAFLDNVLTIVSKKSAVTEPSCARYGADDFGRAPQRMIRFVAAA
jgi:hypothetical protein